jgi:hypothetical protein
MYFALIMCTVGAAAMMATVYEDHKDEDGFLYITYSGENTFGDFEAVWFSHEYLQLHSVSLVHAAARTNNWAGC